MIFRLFFNTRSSLCLKALMKKRNFYIDFLSVLLVNNQKSIVFAYFRHSDLPCA